MIRRLTLVLVAATMIVVADVSAQTGGTASPFAMGFGSRDLALGGANASSCDFATASYWNAARLARSERFGVMGFHTRLYDEGVAYQYLGIVVPTLDWGTVGIGVARLGVNDIERRDESNLLLGTFDDHRLNMRIGYGRTIGSFDFGAAISLETHSIDTYRATSTPGLDLAISRVMSAPFGWCESLSFTLVGRNIIEPSMRLADQAIKTPAEWQAGFSARLLRSADQRLYLELAGGLAKTQAASAEGSMGLEVSVMDLLRLRGSVRDDKFAGGVGIATSGISFDYAMVDRELGLLHTISLTTHFGKSVSDRLSIRARRREADFDRAMNDRLVERNSQMAAQLLETGKTALSAGDLTAAEANLDRALFLARSSGVDTLEYATLAEQVRSQILLASRTVQLAQHLDSARAHLAERDYLGCQYFAGLALALDSTFGEASALRDQAQQASAEQTRQQDFIQQKAWAIDSLISYGALDEALAAARSVNRIAPENPLVQLALRKAEFEWFMSRAEDDLTAGEYRRTLTLLDSALDRFPGHTRCLELRQTCQTEMRALQSDSATHFAESPALSGGLLKQVSGLYDKAQAAFVRGELSQAIASWEEVERLAPGYQAVREYLLKAYRFVGADLYGQNRLNEALIIWEKALKLAPGNTEIAAYARRTRSEIEKLKALTYDNN